KSAARIALHVMRAPRNDVEVLAQALIEVKTRIKFCSVCFNLTEEDPCSICRNPKRDHSVICVVETPSDVLMIEKTKGYRGLFHVLGGALSPLEGISPETLRIQELTQRIGDSIHEVILATNPTTEGDATALYLAQVLKPKGVRVTRIACGVPVGSDLEHVDEVTLTKALEGRSEIP
ncbi:MAG: recombination protein RecR, partial [Calditrichaeota bacterium]|nr:recombination protein RecR [Calditrichota bacterium]